MMNCSNTVNVSQHSWTDDILTSDNTNVITAAFSTVNNYAVTYELAPWKCTD